MKVDLAVASSSAASRVVAAILPVVEQALHGAIAAAAAELPGGSPASPAQRDEAVRAAAAVLLLGLEHDANALETLAMVSDLALGLIERRAHAVAACRDGATLLQAAVGAERDVVVADTHRALAQLDPAFAELDRALVASTLRACSPMATKGRRPGPPATLAKLARACDALSTPGDPFASVAEAAKAFSDAARLWKARVARNAKRRKASPPT